MTNEITVFIRGGAVQEIIMPEGTVVTVVDWDIDEGDEDDMTLFDGERAYVSEWLPPYIEEEHEPDEQMSNEEYANARLFLHSDDEQEA